MNEKQIKIGIYAICLLMPLLPTFIVMSIIYQILNIYGIIIVLLIEYFGFQYIIALFIKRIAERRVIEQKKRQEIQRE